MKGQVTKQLREVYETVIWAEEYHTKTEEIARRIKGKTPDQLDLPLTAALVEARATLEDVLDMEELQDE